MKWEILLDAIQDVDRFVEVSDWIINERFIAESPVPLDESKSRYLRTIYSTFFHAGAL